MKRWCYSPLEIILTVFVFAVLSTLFIPTGRLVTPRRTACAHNLMQLYKLGTVYSSTHKGEWPDVSGEELWLSFTKTTPPLIAPEYIDLLACPLRDEECEPGRTHYFGPKVPYKKLGYDEPLGGDKPGNHGEEGGYVLFKDGRVEEGRR